ncbi:hypothetical protein ABG79_00473 [Caloramator mitchellensis]|uniref:Uncharacterized protein n=1 Tax=Caloramator mitchellensis TaxID=908809 RepID=A0A0R3JVW8_CALMK|nr:DUF58 domain-containing protein [Caloramator mitchellensis]KRQ87672.1 hypothetical protein ABG79_00473 [Caloramator mitchellensis]
MFLALLLIVVLALYINNLSQKYSFYNLFYSIKFSKSVLECHEEFEISFIIENKKILPITYLQINQNYPKEFQFINIDSDVNVFKTTLSILPYQRIKRSFLVKCSSRGRYLLYNANLICGDLLGLKQFSRDFEFSREIIVLPKPYDLKNKLKPIGSFLGDLSVKRWIIEDPILTVGLREYTGNEPLKYIHWPTSMKNQRLMVKEFDYTTDNNILLYLNIETSKPFWEKIDSRQIEKVISITRAIIDKLESEKIPYGIKCNAQNYMNINLSNTGLGKKHYMSILESLGRIDYSIFTPFEEILKNNRSMNYTTAVVITPSIFNEYVAEINRLKDIYQKVVLITLEKNNVELMKNIEIYFEGND